MKSTRTIIMTAGVLAVWASHAADEIAPSPIGTSQTNVAIVTNLVVQPAATVAIEAAPQGGTNDDGSATGAALAPPASPDLASTNLASMDTNTPSADNPNYDGEGLRLNFRGVPLEMVLDYFSEAAGFIIVLETQPRGKVDVWSNHPVSKEEAVNLLNSVLRKNGYAAIRNGRTLTIVNRDEAKTKDIPVNLGSDPKEIPRTDEVVTQIIPVRFVEAVQLIKDLQPLVSTQTAITANESGNSIVITDTQANIRRVAEIIRAIDLGAEDVTLVRVFRLTNSDPSEMADLLATLFPDDTRSGGSQSPVQFGGMARFFGGPGGPGGRGGGSSQGSSTGRIRKRARVLAVPDQRTSSVIVSAAKDLMDQIEGVITDIDQSAAKKQSVQVFSLQNADPGQAMEVLQDIFQKNTTGNNRNSANQNNSALGNRSTQQMNQQNNNTSSRGSTRGGGGTSRTSR